MITDSSLDTLFATKMAGNTEGRREEPFDAWKAPGSRSHQPIIGIPIPVKQSHQGPLLVTDAVSAWAIERMQGRIFLIPLWPFPTHKHQYQSLWPLIQLMDGLVLPAGIQGGDWHPLGKEQKQGSGPESWPMAWEMALAQLATYIGMPILAIGDGAETWNSALGGKRRSHVATDASTSALTPDTWDRRTIRVRAQSTLATALQPALTGQEGEQKPWELPFMPNQGVEHIAPGLRSCAQSEDGTVVAFERRDEAFGLGMVGRLDWGLDHIYGTTLFDAFLHACQSFDQTRHQQSGWESARHTICRTVYDLVTHGQSLVPLPHQSIQEEKQPRSSSLSTPLSTERRGGQERMRQRAHPPTKEEWSRIKRQKLKGMSR
ncbi:gamma-glutamyl-gamma-aminobutyrate hydrolase family protein [Tengunoibacter tsumagoiensis]|uniref:Uncharacterized protein n=1 Tax=Tengunoibacter tsumagoiensis TaxID=2014871 RepID=A0A402A7B0_9CHLR|nr:gamma-glutamyl-gamma-aminobutyrate hydrolase family protein [Tengunoibacter tsumagoiensis]GCE15022.1 hypothetical protein KTT_48810 [Tengunoibacter tsumagoiensis]